MVLKKGTFSNEFISVLTPGIHWNSWKNSPGDFFFNIYPSIYDTEVWPWPNIRTKIYQPVLNFEMQLFVCVMCIAFSSLPQTFWVLKSSLKSIKHGSSEASLFDSPKRKHCQVSTSLWKTSAGTAHVQKWCQEEVCATEIFNITRCLPSLLIFFNNCSLLFS